MYYYSLKFRCDHTHTRPVTSHGVGGRTALQTIFERINHIINHMVLEVEPRYKSIFERINHIINHMVFGVEPRYKPIFERINRMVLGEGATGENTPTFWTTQRGRVTSSVVDSLSSRPQGRRISSGHIWLRNLVRNEM